MTEHTEQAAVFEWASLMSNRYPELQLLFAIPNAGKRSYGAAAWMRNEGLKKGVPDMMLPVSVVKYKDDNSLKEIVPPGWTKDIFDDRPKYGLHGLFIEMKMKPNKTTPEQNYWLYTLNSKGYYATVCYSADEAIKVICEYLGIDEP